MFKKEFKQNIGLPFCKQTPRDPPPPPPSAYCTMADSHALLRVWGRSLSLGRRHPLANAQSWGDRGGGGGGQGDGIPGLRFADAVHTRRGMPTYTAQGSVRSRSNHRRWLVKSCNTAPSREIYQGTPGATFPPPPPRPQPVLGPPSSVLTRARFWFRGQMCEWQTRGRRVWTNPCYRMAQDTCCRHKPTLPLKT